MALRVRIVRLGPPLLVLAALADAATYLLLPLGAEANPLWQHQPSAAVLVKALVLAYILVVPLGRYAARVRWFGALAWSLGALTNLNVLLWR